MRARGSVDEGRLPKGGQRECRSLVERLGAYFHDVARPVEVAERHRAGLREHAAA